MDDASVPLRHDDDVAAKKKTPALKTYIAYRIAGLKFQASPPLPFVVTAKTFTAAKQRIVSEWAHAASKLPHGFIVSFSIQPGDVGPKVNSGNVTVQFKGRMPGDHHVVTVDRTPAIRVRQPKQKRGLRKGMSYVGFIAMLGQGYRWFLIPEPAYMKAREWVLRKAARFHASNRNVEAEFGMAREHVLSTASRAAVKEMSLSPRETLVRLRKGPGAAASWTIMGEFSRYRPKQKYADEKVFLPEMLKQLVRGLKGDAEK